MLRTIEVKLYPNQSQAETLAMWLRQACWVYNRALENRIKRYKRRKQSTSYLDQQAMLTQWRSRMPQLESIPLEFARDGLRRVDRGFKAFFRRLKAGEKPGFPRFRASARYNSLECLAPSKYADGRTVRVPKLGHIRSRGPAIPDGVQRLVRVIRRASGWFAQIVINDGRKPPAPKTARSSIGIDLGLSAFATLSDGQKIDNPRWLRRSTRKLRSVQRRVSRKKKGSCNRRKAVWELRRVHDRVASQRRNFCHWHSTAMVRQFDLIAVENLNVQGMARSRLAKSIRDAAWSTFVNQLERKAECAGVTLVKVDPRGTSQECPECGQPCPKDLSVRIHACSCGCVLDRDHAAARVILNRALGVNRGVTPVEGSASGPPLIAVRQAGPVKQEDSSGSW